MVHSGPALLKALLVVVGVLSLLAVSFATSAATAVENQAPVAVDDSIEIEMNSINSIPAATFLANDFDPDGDPLAIVATCCAVNGSGGINGPAQLVGFFPDEGFVGTASMKYQISDGALFSNLATITFIVLAPPIISVSIDIKPGGDPNSITLGSKGLISVAILTTPTFDATTVDANTVQLGPGAATKAHANAHVEDVDADGDLDLALHFRTPETGIAPGDTEACLTGETFDGTPIEGCDAIRTVP
ncbi:MAG: cadherin-like domain-containing protein [Chloroflexi bacterium]|nr:cadherin-like domain-containing protein [Chloroflexota bacterium]